MRFARRTPMTMVLALLVVVSPLHRFGTEAASASETCPTALVCTSNPPSTPPAPTPPVAPAPAPAPPPSTTTTTAPPAPAQPSQADAISTLLGKVNHERTSRGLPALELRADVSQIAAAWSVHLADVGTLSHNDEYFSSATRHRLGGRALGENVARNTSIGGAHTSLMKSPHHRDNILDARFLVIGLGVELRNGSWFITEDFLQPARPARPATAARRSAAASSLPTPHAATPVAATLADATAPPTTESPRTRLTIASTSQPIALPTATLGASLAGPGDRPEAGAAAVAVATVAAACLRVRRRRSSATAR